MYKHRGASYCRRGCVWENRTVLQTAWKSMNRSVYGFQANLINEWECLVWFFCKPCVFVVTLQAVVLYNSHLSGHSPCVCCRTRCRWGQKKANHGSAVNLINIISVLLFQVAFPWAVLQLWPAPLSFQNVWKCFVTQMTQIISTSCQMVF